VVITTTTVVQEVEEENKFNKMSVAPQEDKPELKEHLSKAGIKMNDKKIRKNSDARMGQMGGNVKVSNNNHPNNRSSYDGIFGS
jgi:hypothetical protein